MDRFRGRPAGGDPVSTPHRIVAEVWDRYLLQVPHSDPVSRHRTMATAHLACARANYLLSNPDGSYPTPDGKPPCVVYAIRTHDRLVEVTCPSDPTEATRRILQAEINTEAAAIPEEGSRTHWEARYGVGNVWSTAELSATFTIHSFAAPFCRVTRLSDGVSGWLQFAHSPRNYFNFQPQGER